MACNKTPLNYDLHPFSIDGKMDLDITFKRKMMCTPAYIKMDANEQLRVDLPPVRDRQI